MKKILLATLAGGLALTMSASAFAADVTMRISLQLPMKSHLGQNLALCLLYTSDAADDQ